MVNDRLHQSADVVAGSRDVGLMSGSFQLPGCDITDTDHLCIRQPGWHANGVHAFKISPDPGSAGNVR